MGESTTLSSSLLSSFSARVVSAANVIPSWAKSGRSTVLVHFLSGGEGGKREIAVVVYRYEAQVVDG